MERITFSRKDSFINNLKNSTPQGIGAVIIEILGLIMVVAGLIWSYSKAGNAGYGLGVLMDMALIFSIVGVILASKGLKNKQKIRHNLERHAIWLGVILIVMLVGVFIWGAYTYFHK